jgi:tRNA pseudouridine13 synthase
MSTEGPMMLPYATAKSRRVLAKFRERPEDFRVDEVPAYAPSGTGEHLFVRFEKTGLNTRDAVDSLARALGSDPRQAGFAGLKDRHAVTTQWASFFHADAALAQGLELPGIRVLEAVPHPHKLRTGHLHANRFRIRLRDAGPDALPIARELLAELLTAGTPNYYGEQRFGQDAQNVGDALRWLRDGGPAPRDPWKRKLLVSAWQSALFNRWLGERVERGELGRAIAGDLMRKEDSGGLFVSEDQGDAQRRLDAWAISPTGPMFGLRMRWPAQEAERIERALWAELGLPDEALSRVSKLAEGTRRVARVRPEALEVDAEGPDLLLAFSLPKGAYATVILRELMKPD